MLAAGKLRHRIVLQKPVRQQDGMGDMITTWKDIAKLWAAIEPLSARDFVSAGAEQDKISGRITIRYKKQITDDMRVFHPFTGKYYAIAGILPDKESGLEYLTLVVSEGAQYQ